MGKFFRAVLTVAVLISAPVLAACGPTTAVTVADYLAARGIVDATAYDRVPVPEAYPKGPSTYAILSQDGKLITLAFLVKDPHHNRTSTVIMTVNKNAIDPQDGPPGVLTIQLLLSPKATDVLYTVPGSQMPDLWTDDGDPSKRAAIKEFGDEPLDYLAIHFTGGLVETRPPN